jgi:AsmA family
MTEDEQGRQRKRGRIWLALGALVAILAVLIVPPFLSVSRYKSRITSLMASSLGRPVRLSSVRLRLLPRPGFVLYDLVVDEDPGFGAEPLLRASSVVASIRLLSLWRGRLEISEVSVDDASLNLVRTPQGNWNLEPLFRTAATNAGAPNSSERHAPPFPYIAATNSRVNFKNGFEKLPFSLIDTDLSFWQENPGVWRIRLRGQPARTDVSLDLADTGVLELNASAQDAPDLHQMPIRLDLDWRDAQLGQLTRLATGSDAGWRGDLRGEVHLEGTAASAKVTTRLRATDVHRAEFAPLVPMDFDANCGFIYHYSARALEGLLCDSPLGDGHIQLAGDLPSEGGPSHFSVEMDRIPVAAGLDALRTVRSGIGPDLAAAGTVSGKITYDEVPSGINAHAQSGHHIRSSKANPVQGPLAGSFTVDGFQLSGNGLSRPIQAPKLVLEPAAVARDHVSALAGTVAVPMGGTAPLIVNVRLGLKGYQVATRGQVSIARGRELAQAVGISQASSLNDLAGDPLTVDLTAEGPWLPATELPVSEFPASQLSTGTALPSATAPEVAAATANRGAKGKPTTGAVATPATDVLNGTVIVHNANWKADYLANHVVISEATLHVGLVAGQGDSDWDGVAFEYGPLKGTASFTVPGSCSSSESCPTRFQVQFGDLDAATVQTAILGAHEKGTLLSALINKLRPSSAPAWPQLEGTVKADSLVLGPVTLQDAMVGLRFKPAGAEITSLDAELLGGSVHGTGTLAAGDKPDYTLTGDFEKLNPVSVGQLLGETWRGGTFDANGTIELSGYTGADLADSAKGTLHFDWRHGAIAGGAPQQLTRFDRWSADAAIANGKIALGQNQIAQGGHKGAVEAAATLDEAPKVTFTAAKAASAKKH